MSGRHVLSIALAYGLGCLCAGYYVVRWRTGTDVRRIGSSVAGHVLPVQLWFRGGKGIAPSIGALLVYDPWVVLASALVVGLAYLPSGRRLVPSDLTGCALAPPPLAVASPALAPPTGILLHRSRVELAVLVALALMILVAHRDNLRAALRPVSATS